MFVLVNKYWKPCGLQCRVRTDTWSCAVDCGYVDNDADIGVLVDGVGKAKINLDSKSTINISEEVVNERKEEIESALNPTNDKESVSRNGQESIENPEYKECSVFFSSC